MKLFRILALTLMILDIHTRSITYNMYSTCISFKTTEYFTIL